MIVNRNIKKLSMLIKFKKPKKKMNTLNYWIIFGTNIMNKIN